MKFLPALFSLALAAIPARQTGMTVGPSPDGGTMVPTGQVVRGVGDSLSFPGRPVDLALSPDGATLCVKDDRGLVVIDALGWKLRQELAFPAGGGSMHGIAISRDGRRVYLTDAGDLLHEATLGNDGRFTWTRTVSLQGPDSEGSSYPCGIALSPDERNACVCLSRNNCLGVVDLATGTLTAQIPVGVAPYDVALSRDGGTAWVSNWGGRRPSNSERTAPSSGTPTRVDERGIAAGGSVSLVDLSRRREIAQVETGLHPSDIELSADGKLLFVANANSDTVSEIDTAARRVIDPIPMRPDRRLPFGSAPDALALKRDGRRLFVAEGGNNAVAVVALRSGDRRRPALEGLVPTDWYPGAVVTDGRRLFVANVKGRGSRGPRGAAMGWNSNQCLGTVTRIKIPAGAPPRAWTARARADGRVAQALSDRGATAGTPSVPVPARVGEPSVFEHVVYVIKENRTYDQVLGDLQRGNGDPSLCLYGREITPNHHALAEQFVLLDNFYCNGVLSADGHSWATEGNVTSYLEKAFGGFTRSYTFGDDPLTYSSSGFLWDNALAHGRTFRNYGEMDYAAPLLRAATSEALYRALLARKTPYRFSQNIGIERLRRLSCRDYPGWNLIVPDVLRADRFLKELAEYERSGTWPSLVLVYLPNDHTSGTVPGKPTPRAQVADNDLALGRIVEGISRGRFWPKTCLFVTEDDPQDGFDHVDGHRSFCLVVSPYTKRGAVAHSFYNQTSVLHTIERMLGLPPMNQMDAMAPTMEACFTAKPDWHPYHCQPNRVALDEINPPAAKLSAAARHLARQSAALPLDRPDVADEDTLNRILWHAARGASAPYPAAMAGAHRRGLQPKEVEDRGP